MFKIKDVWLILISVLREKTIANLQEESIPLTYDTSLLILKNILY